MKRATVREALYRGAEGEKGKEERLCYLETLRQKDHRKQNLWRDLCARSPKG